MDIPSKNKPAAGRYALRDELRGLDLLSMIGYHACWDLIFLFGMSAAWYTGWQGHLWQQSICWVFILLSGFCLPLGHRPLRRGLIVSGAGVLVTAVTLLFMPEDRVVFGVLTLLGAAMLITGLLQPLLQKIPAWAGLVVSLLLFAATYHTQDGFWQLGPWQLHPLALVFALSGSLMVIQASTGRIELLSNGECRSDDVDAFSDRLVEYAAAGFRALCQPDRM